MRDIHIDTSKSSLPPTPPHPTPKICGVGGFMIIHKRWLKVKGEIKKIQDPSYNLMIC